MALISVIIPTYNAEKTVRETIESVLDQTFTDFEIIFINDGSQDSTLEIVNSINDSRLKVFTYSNGGSNASRNRGLSHASGEFVSFLDADDLWTPDKLESQLKALQENPEAAVAYSWTDCIDESGKFSRRGSYISVSGDVYSQLLLVDFLEHGSNPLIRRDLFKEVGGFDELLTHAEDWDMWLRLAARYNFIAVPSTQILYRVSTHSASSELAKMEQSCLKVIERGFERASPSQQNLKNYSIGNIYKYLIFKSLESSPTLYSSVTTARFLWCAVIHDPSLLLARVTLKVLLKIIVLFFLPPNWSQALLVKLGKISNTSTILGYLRIDS